ncbi:MAG: tRNA pseudouridine(55) synthase TruB [Firmicutes bacterium]|nr:tRNA pseudouridine(55) synthase TruB [Bacillota bacterium]
MNGFINILKPPGLTSHDVVKYIRTLFPGVKVGHGGTLDPGAAGVLPILLGKATKFFSYIVDFSKIYRAELFLGVSTDSADSSGKIIAAKEPYTLDIEEIKKVLTSFTGEIQQTPPMFSAIKHKGKKLYEYARRGKSIERKPRTVYIFYIKIIDYFPPKRVLLEVKCSKGTYVRTLCSQIGDALGFGGHMSFLLRREVGDFKLLQANTFENLDHLSSMDNLKKAILPLDFPFQNGGKVVLNRDRVNSLIHERFLPFNKSLDSATEPVDGKIVPVYTTKGDFVGLGRLEEDSSCNFVLKPEKIIIQV